MTTIHEKLAAINAALDSVPLDSYVDISPAELAQAQESLARLGEWINALKGGAR